MSIFDLSQIQTVDEAASFFEQVYVGDASFQCSCNMMGNRSNIKEAEQMIEAFASHPLAEDVFRTCIFKSTQSYCIFYVFFDAGVSSCRVPSCLAFPC